jgi:hypothetical protein
VAGNKASVLGNKVLSKLGGKANVEQLSKLKTDEELRADIDKIEGKEAFIDPDDKTLDQGAIQAAIDQAKEQLKDPNITADLKKSKQEMVNTLQGTLDNLQARERNPQLRDMDSTTDEFNKALVDIRNGAQKQMDKAEYAPSYLADKFRIENTKGAASRLPGEYEIGAYSNFFKQAVAKGDKYGALMAAQTIEQEGDMKDFLKQMKYDNNAKGLTQFYKDHFGGKQGAGKGFDVGEATMTQILRESDKRVKASGDWDLGGKIKYNPDGRRYEEESDPARLDKNIDKRIGEGSLNSLWGSITNKMAIGYDSTNNVNVINETALQALGRVNLDDPQALKALADRINTPFAKAITTISKVTKDQAGVDRFKSDLIGNWTKNAYTAAGGEANLTDDQKAQIAKKAERAYKMLQYGAQEANKEASAEYKRVNQEVNELRGYGKQAQANAQQTTTGQATVPPPVDDEA